MKAAASKKSKVVPIRKDTLVSFSWVKTTKDQWITAKIPVGETCTPRVKQLGSPGSKHEWFCSYRDGRYLGHEKTLEAAQKLCLSGETKPIEKEVAEWEKQHPGEIPPFLRLSDEERAAHRHANPPRPGAVRSAGASIRPKEDPATARLRAALETSSGKGAKRQAKAEAAGLDPAAVLARAKDGNPKKQGSGAYARWALLLECADAGKKVSEFLAKKGNPTTLENAIKSGYVKLEEGR